MVALSAVAQEKETNDKVVTVVEKAAEETNTEGASDKILPYELKSRSEFTIDPKARVPFWRIGWEKPDPRKPNKDPDPNPNHNPPPDDIPKGTFKVTSIMIGPPSIAIINGRSVEEGEYITLRRGEDKQRVLIQQILAEGVYFEINQVKTWVPIYRVPDPKLRSPDELTPRGEFEVVLPR